MWRAAVAAVAVGVLTPGAVAAAAVEGLEAEVGPVVFVARVQQPAQLLTQTPEAETR